MDINRVREALKTVLMLSKTASRKHSVEIDWVGKVRIESKTAAVLSANGKQLRLTKDNMEERLMELLSETYEEKVKRRIKQLVFS